MKAINKCIAILIVPAIMGLYLPANAADSGQVLLAGSAEKKVTQHPPKIMRGPSKKLSSSKPIYQKKYLWIGLGSLLLVGGAAAIAGSGSGGDDGGGDNSSTEGSFSVEW